MPTKVLTRKTKKSARKPAKKAVKKNTKKSAWDEIEEGFKKLQKSQDEAWSAIWETQQAVKETHDSIFGINKSKDEAWAAIREAQVAVKETHDSIFGINKSKDEAWAAIREAQAAVKETQKNIGGINNTLGSLVEHIMTPDLPQKFKKFGFSFSRVTTIKYAEGVYAEIDALLENGMQAVVVEIKTTLRQADIDDHLLRMEKVRKYADEHDDKRQFMGAIAATITDKSTREYALKKGLFVIEPSGEDVKVTKPAVKPRIW
jgi:hypothetical protein